VTVVELVERRANEDGTFELDVRFPGGGYGVQVADPFAGDPAGEALLAWYFQEHLKFPFLDKDLEQRAVALLAVYGKDLFGQVFGSDDGCKHEYLKLKERGFDACRLEVTPLSGREGPMPLVIGRSLASRSWRAGRASGRRVRRAPSSLARGCCGVCGTASRSRSRSWSRPPVTASRRS
jgi:hypothetical protein